MSEKLETNIVKSTDQIVLDDELLYRCIFFGKNYYQIQDNRVIISSQAFSDRSQAPSVDRACLCDFNPIYTQKDQKDGVISLIAKEVRLIDVFQKDSKGNLICTYKIDVYPRPIENNLAHAQIEPTPEYKNKSVFKKLLERLAFIANEREWEIKPYELRE